MEFGYYPYFNLVKAKVDLSSYQGKDKVKEVIFSVISSGGDKIGPQIKIPRESSQIKAEWKLPPLKEGAYYLIAQIVREDKVKPLIIRRIFKYKHFPWEHNKIGKSNIIVPPFKPLKVVKSKREVFALLTGYQISKGFWSKVYAQGENILSAPIELVLNEGKIPLEEEDFRFTRIRDNLVEAVTTLKSNSLRIKVKHEYDYDGMCKVKISLEPEGKVELYEGKIIIPLKASVAQLMHIVSDCIRSNPAGYIPEGEGVVWDSREIVRDKLLGTFVPYVWLGGIYKGFCWFADNDKGWVVEDSKPEIEILRRKGEVILQINIINKSTLLTSPREIVMGFQPTPVKPRMKGWRRLCHRWKAPVAQAIKFSVLPGCGVLGAWSMDRYPRGHDYSLIRKINEARKGKPKSFRSALEIADEYIDKYLSKREEKIKRKVRRRIFWAFDLAREARFLIPYIDTRAAYSEWPEYTVYEDEWGFSEYRTGAGGPGCGDPVESYQDFTLYYVRKLVREGMDGLYYDDTYLRSIPDPVTGDAYVREDGKIQPHVGIFHMRELFKRTATMLFEEGKGSLDERPFLIAHMTNANIIPIMSFATVGLDWEMKYGDEDVQDRFSEGFILAESLGTQAGMVPVVLMKITTPEPPLLTRITRTFLAVILAYDIPLVMRCRIDDSLFEEVRTLLMRFGYGREEVKVYPCWRRQDYVRVLSKGIKAALYIKEGKAMLIISDFGSDGKAEIFINKKKFGWSHFSIKDVESGEEIKLNSGKIKVPLQKHDFRILLIEEEKK